MYPVKRYQGRLWIGTITLLLLAGSFAAPAMDEIVSFFSDAPYVQYLPDAASRTGAAARVLGDAVAVIRFTHEL
jgi:hypothetical protein